MAADADALLVNVRKLRDALRASKAVNVNKGAIRDQARSLVQTYFREVRPQAAQFAETASLADLDGLMQRLLSLCNGLNAKSTYVAMLKPLTKAIEGLGFSVELARSDIEIERMQSDTLTAVEQRIYSTLSQMLPAAALSYVQAIEDIAAERHSYRGPAIELRETVREVLDHMAPDADVMAMPGYKQDKSTSGPTMTQKARYIMKQRRTSDTSSKPTLEATEIVDETTAKIVRSTYQSGSLSVHVSPSHADVQQLKMHADAVLAGLLNIFA